MKKTGKNVLLILMLQWVLLGCNSKDVEPTLEQLLGSSIGAYELGDAKDYQTEYVWVHICGEVEKPGVYQVEATCRIYDVLMEAGGFTQDADTRYVNLAEQVKDSMQIVIPSQGEVSARYLDEQDGLININTASEEKLCTLPGIGQSRAKDIIAYRENRGGFSSTEEIMKVSGIKESTFSKIKELITIGK